MTTEQQIEAAALSERLSEARYKLVEVQEYEAAMACRDAMAFLRKHFAPQPQPSECSIVKRFDRWLIRRNADQWWLVDSGRWSDFDSFAKQFLSPEAAADFLAQCRQVG